LPAPQGRGTPLFLFKPTRILNIIVSNALNLIPSEFRAHVCYLFGRHTCINTTGFYMRTLEHDCTGGNNTVAFYHTIIHNNASHAYKHIVMYRTAMNYGIMANGHIITNVGGGFLIGTVNNSTVLHIYLIS